MEDTYFEFRYLHSKLAWLTNSRPYIVCPVAKLFQVFEHKFETKKDKNLKSMKGIIRHRKQNQIIVQKYPEPDKDSVKIVCYWDPSFATNDDYTTQLGYFIFLSDKINNF